MKIEDVGLFIENGKLLIGQKNKRGNVKTGAKDVTHDVMDFVLKRLETEKSFFIHHINKETSNHYAIKCELLNDYEIKMIEKQEAVRAKNAQRSYGFIKTLFKNMITQNILS